MISNMPLHLSATVRGWRMKCLFLAQTRQAFDLDGLRPDDSAFLQRLCDVFCYLFESAPTGNGMTATLTPIS